MPSKEILRGVFDAAERTYKISGHTVFRDKIKEKIGVDLGMVIPDLKRIEYVFSDKLQTRHISKLSEYRQYGYEIWILVPLFRMWENNDLFRGKVDYLQPWREEGGEFKFGNPVIP